MKASPTQLPEVLLIEPDVYGDQRGWFMESWQAERYKQHGVMANFTQANISYSEQGVLRGLHYQYPQPQGKLVYVLAGSVFDVAVDIRHGSPTFGQWVGAELSAENHHQLWVPEGFAHGFQVLSGNTTFAYFCTRKYHPEYDAAIAHDDLDIGIKWPLPVSDISAKDRDAPGLLSLSPEQLPGF